jgi:ATP-dependent Clp protease ATP-binding subunit ClpC
LEAINYKLSLSDEAKKFLAEKGYDPQFGARPLHRAIQKYLEDPLAEFILSDNSKEGSLIATFDKENSKVIITKEVTEKSLN